jgi:hypothetical protein
MVCRDASGMLVHGYKLLFAIVYQMPLINHIEYYANPIVKLFWHQIFYKLDLGQRSNLIIIFE